MQIGEGQVKGFEFDRADFGGADGRKQTGRRGLFLQLEGTDPQKRERVYLCQYPQTRRTADHLPPQLQKNRQTQGGPLELVCQTQRCAQLHP